MKQPRKGPYDVTDYQTSHLCGGAIMGDNPGNSALNRYLQSWDVPNLFVQGATAFPQNAGYNPTGTVGALAFWSAWQFVRNISRIRGRSSMRNLNSMRVALCGLALALSSGGAVAGDIDKQDFEQIERGRYLTIVGDCAACHTLPGSGHAYAGGRAIETPFGDILAPNITPDQQTGIGAWTDDEFVNAMQNGTGRNGKLLFPAMPYTYYTRVTRDDVLAIRAYLNTVPAVQNPVNADQLPFPLNIRQSMIIWKRLFLRPGEFQP